jgi:hypothetical protein
MNNTRDLVFLFDVDHTRLNIDLHHFGDLLKYDLAAFLKNELREGKV